MTHNEFEKKQLQQINDIDKRLDEGIGSTFLNLLFRGTFKKVAKKAAKHLKDSPELKAKISDIMYQVDDLKDHMERWCEENPDIKC